nr:MAG TPA: hypothetical protein [Caudoviricetes sp.]
MIHYLPILCGLRALNRSSREKWITPHFLTFLIPHLNPADLRPRSRFFLRIIPHVKCGKIILNKI